MKALASLYLTGQVSPLALCGARQLREWLWLCRYDVVLVLEGGVVRGLRWSGARWEILAGVQRLLSQTCMASTPASCGASSHHFGAQ